LHHHLDFQHVLVALLERTLVSAPALAKNVLQGFTHQQKRHHVPFVLKELHLVKDRARAVFALLVISQT
jgi:hypothetical protein